MRGQPGSKLTMFGPLFSESDSSVTWICALQRKVAGGAGAGAIKKRPGRGVERDNVDVRPGDYQLASSVYLPLVAPVPPL
jgi:hypothetical protein